MCDRPEAVAEEAAKGDSARCTACCTAEFSSELPTEGARGFTHSAENISGPVSLKQNQCLFSKMWGL